MMFELSPLDTDAKASAFSMPASFIQAPYQAPSFFWIGSSPGAFAALKALSRRNSIVILTNAPADALDLRTQWLRKNGLHYPLVVNEGLKGPIAAKLVAQTETRSAFVDDLLMHLDSVAEHSPRTATFQHVADERLRAIAPSSERHVRIDDWPRLAAVIEETLQA